MDVVECNEAFAVQNLAVAASWKNNWVKKWFASATRGTPTAVRSPSAIPTARLGALRFCMFTMRELIRQMRPVRLLTAPAAARTRRSPRH
jgi:hypothetical protein